jgi:probable rRNA maturation factor
MKVEIIDETGRFRRRDLLRRALGALGDELGAGPRELTLVLVGDEVMAARNLVHRGVWGPTDVLSYPLHEPDDLAVPVVSLLGDVVVNLDAAARQAHERGAATYREVLVLSAHGVLHLLGFDHPDAASWRPFEAAQGRVLELADALRQGATAAPAAAAPSEPVTPAAQEGSP